MGWGGQSPDARRVMLPLQFLPCVWAGLVQLRDGLDRAVGEQHGRGTVTAGKWGSPGPGQGGQRVEGDGGEPHSRRRRRLCRGAAGATQPRRLGCPGRAPRGGGGG